MFAVHINDPILPYPGSRHCSPSPPRAVWFRKRLIMRHEKGARQEWLTRVLLPSCSMLAWLGHKQVLNKSYLQGRFLSVNLCCSSSPSYHSSSFFYSIYVVLVSSFSFWRTLLHTHTHTGKYNFAIAKFYPAPPTFYPPPIPPLQTIHAPPPLPSFHPLPSSMHRVTWERTGYI